MNNPYQPPLATSAAGSPGAPGTRCPQCRSTRLKDPKFTWWGGLLGPKLLKHRVCSDCGFGFNRETGLGNRNKVIVYVVVASVLGAVLILAYAWFVLTHLL